MKQQLKGNKMKKKSVTKKNLGGLLTQKAEMLSPIYGIAKGKGPFSGLAAALGKTGMSPLGSFALEKRNKRKQRDAAKQAGMAMTPMQRMFMGGKVKRSKPIDGIAIKGKTKAT
tara:strand:- start:471 stop:812 length:342 start_codon:yes stop_codon:yes gene_type:complete